MENDKWLLILVNQRPRTIREHHGYSQRALVSISINDLNKRNAATDVYRKVYRKNQDSTGGVAFMVVGDEYPSLPPNPY